MNPLPAISPGPVFDLIACSPVPVRFEGTRERHGPLTLGQLNILEWLTREFEQPHAYISRHLDLPRTARLEDVVESVAVILTRHEALRTRFVGGERPHQVVLASGVFLIDVYELVASGTDLESMSRAALAAELCQRLRDEVAVRAGPLPLRVAVAMASGVVHAGAVCFSHQTVDDFAVAIVGREIAELVRVPAARLVGAPRHQPVDQAELEHGDAMRARADGTLAYWQRQLLNMPQCLYAAPRVGSTASAVIVEMSSPAATAALGHIAARTRMSRSSAVLAAICALLARRTGYRRLVFPALSGNRFERHLSDYVGTLAQSTLTVVDTGTPSFDQLVSRAWAATINSSRQGMYDVYRRTDLVRRVERDRGVRFDFEPLFNSTVFDDAVPGQADGVPTPRPDLPDPGLTTLRSEELPRTPTMIRFDLFSVADEIHLAVRAGDTSRIPAGDAEVLLLAIERMLVAATYGDLDSKRIEEVIAMDPIPRAADWLFVNPHWVEESEVRHLVQDALAPNPCQVFREAAASGEVLVAYVAASESLRTPAQAHDLCMGILPGRLTAITPHRYVVCDGAPTQPDDLTGWRRRTLCAGAGR